jgi:ATPases of the AAA+ class
MASPHIRELHPDDLDGVVRLWESVNDGTARPVYSLSEVIASCQKDHAVVALNGEQVVGVAVGRAAHAQGWVVFFATTRDDGVRVGVDLLDELQRVMAPLGIGKLSILIPEAGAQLDELAAGGFQVQRHVAYLERALPVQRRELDLLKEVGGRLLHRGIWDAVSGMRKEKTLLEDRLVTPLSRPELAERFAVVPPRAVMLFGPPGTGKTTFAKAVAARLDWPFIEVFPSRLAGESGGLANALRSTFGTIGELEHAVVFIDEVEEVASRRRGDPAPTSHGVTNELLKLIPEFRERSGRLLICATNFIRSLDPAFLRHGRFDYVIPIGLPDAEARQAIWRRYLPESARAAIDVDALVERSEGLTPADIEYAARRASQEALARALRSDAADDASESVTSDDYLEALRATKATVSEDAAREFLNDIETFARL